MIMTNSLNQLKTLFKQLVSSGKDLSDFGFTCYCEKTALETMREIFFNPSLLIVLTGSLHVVIGSNKYQLKPGDMLVLPEAEVYFSGKMKNNDKASWVAVTFKKDVLDSFINLYGELLMSFNYASSPKAEISPVIINVIYQWLFLGESHRPSSYIRVHRQMELLLLLVERGVGKSIFFIENTSWKHKVIQLLGIDPGVDWNMKDVSSKIGVSVATLRRRLKEEEVSFQKLLEDVRLDSGFKLLRKTDWKVGRISQEVGYQSQSRFGERFKLRYGVKPSELRKNKFAGTP